MESTLSAHNLRLLKPAALSLPIDDFLCRRFDLGSPASDMHTFWVDDSGLIRRIQLLKAGKLANQCDIRYGSRHGIDGFPVSWL
jgi:hypothetical protein